MRLNVKLAFLSGRTCRGPDAQTRTRQLGLVIAWPASSGTTTTMTTVPEIGRTDSEQCAPDQPCAGRTGRACCGNRLQAISKDSKDSSFWSAVGSASPVDAFLSGVTFVADICGGAPRTITGASVTAQVWHHVENHLTRTSA